VADIRGTSPAVWNAWKARLLESLFYATKRVLNNETFSVAQAIATRQQEAAEKLAKYGLQPQSYQSLWDKLGSGYFVRYEPDEIAWQSRLLTPHVNTSNPIVRARLSPSGDGIQDLFARICNFFDRMAYNIVQAKIYTTNHGYALNSFIVLDQSGKSVSYSGLLKFIETELTGKIVASNTLDAPLEGRVSRQVKHMPFATRVNIHKESGGITHTLEIVAGDRPGLLAKIAFIFLQLDVDLHNAKINTLGNRAEDSFLISAKQQQALNTAQIDALNDNLSKL
jgi:[protein-PII] uridylyltransferase